MLLALCMLCCRYDTRMYDEEGLAPELRQHIRELAPLALPLGVRTSWLHGMGSRACARACTLGLCLCTSVVVWILQAACSGKRCTVDKSLQGWARSLEHDRAEKPMYNFPPLLLPFACRATRRSRCRWGRCRCWARRCRWWSKATCPCWARSGRRWGPGSSCATWGCAWCRASCRWVAGAGRGL